MKFLYSENIFTGKIYGILGALESATQTFSSPLYSLLYAKTVSTLPDAWLIPGIVLALLQLLSYLITKRLRNVQPDSTIQQEKNIPLPIIEKGTDATKDNDLILKEASNNTKDSL